MPHPSIRHYVRTPGGVISAIAAAGIVAYLAWIINPFKYDPAVEETVSSGILVLLDLFIVLFGIDLTRRQDIDARLRQAWFLIALASLCDMVGEGLWYYYSAIQGTDPFPSLADVFYLLFYPLALAGLIRFPFAPIKRQERITLALDLSIVTISLGMVLWYFVLAPLMLTSEEDLAGILAFTYPIGDLLLLAGVVALIQRDVEKTARWTLTFLAIGMASTGIADILFAYFEIKEVGYSMPFLNIWWMCSSLGILFAATWQLSAEHDVPPSKPAEFSSFHRLLRLGLPYLAILVAFALFAYDIYLEPSHGLRLRGIRYQAGFLISLVFLRQYAVLRENVRLLEEMKRMAGTDQLTGLYNRHFFNETIHYEIERAGRYTKPLSVLLLDVNGFKKFNDTYGHLQGDIVLKTVAQTLAGQLRAADILARYGGDEFVIILPETDKKGAQSVAEKIKGAVAAQSYEGVPLGICAGMAVFQTGQSPEQLLELADRELYRQKASLETTPRQMTSRALQQKPSATQP